MNRRIWNHVLIFTLGGASRLRGGQPAAAEGAGRASLGGVAALVLGLMAVLAVGALFVLLVRRNSGRSDLAQRTNAIRAINAEVGAITPVACPLPLAGEVEGETADCFVYTVPVSYDDPVAGTINLTVVRLRAQSETPLPDPIVYLAGGPGQSGVVAAGGNLYGDLRRERDILFPAQRGTLFAQRLGLEECVALLGNELGRSELEAFADSVAANNSGDRSQPYDEYLANYGATVGAVNSRCHEAFRQAGLDPTQFNTANSTRDLVGLMQALGYTSYNLHGTSYGTRLALETVRRHPDAPIRSLVLDSPSAPTVDRLRTLATAAYDMVMQLFANCAADPACDAAYPDLPARTAALLDTLEATPLTAGERTIGPEEVLDQLRDLSGTRGNYMPRLIAELEAGDSTTYLALANQEVGTRSPEGSATSDAVNDLIQKISLAGLQGTNPLTGIKAVADVLTGAREDDPRAGMKATARRVIRHSESLPAESWRTSTTCPTRHPGAARLRTRRERAGGRSGRDRPADRPVPATMPTSCCPAWFAWSNCLSPMRPRPLRRATPCRSRPWACRTRCWRRRPATAPTAPDDGRTRATASRSRQTSPPLSCRASSDSTNAPPGTWSPWRGGASPPVGVRPAGHRPQRSIPAEVDELIRNPDRLRPDL